MKLSTIKENPIKALDYMERLVNNGSPSGFSEKNTVSDETNPFLSDEFSLLYLENAEQVISYGEVPREYIKQKSILVHPDWRICPTANTLTIIDSKIAAVPTSSGRTVKIKDRFHYLKLSYPGVIGRLLRELDERHIKSSIQINKIFFELLRSPNMPKSFAFLPERGGQLFVKGDFKTGCVYRDFVPQGSNVAKIKYIIPAFSLFGVDRYQPTDELLLHQILKRKYDSSDFLLSQIFLPLIDIYFTCVFEEGLSPELHAQNILFGFDDNDDIVAIVLRDLESVDKDVTIRAELNKSSFTVLDYKAIHAKQFNYKIKHSFMYDHKLGEYLINEIIDCACDKKFICKDNIVSRIQVYVRNKYGEKLENFFPEDGRWYKFKNVEIDRSSVARPYVAFANPILR